ncbi:MAG: hypothetical protein H7318_19560, partial [Oligoflexus sp.]|nr:hypothetical protein [Oligoflexus sp.]
FYRPLEVIFNQGSKCYRLVCDDTITPAIYDGEYFNVIDARFYADWIMAVESERKARLASKEFLKEGFWEDFANERPEALATYKRISNPLAVASFSLSFVYRFMDFTWPTFRILVQNGPLETELACELAASKVVSSEPNELELELSGLDDSETVRIAEILSALDLSGEGKTEASLLLAAWGYENRASLSDPILFLEDVYLKCFPAKEIKGAVPFLNPKNSNEDIIEKWKVVLDEHVYDRILARPPTAPI